MPDEKYQIKIPDLDYFRKMVKCQDACPANTPAGSYVNAIADGDYIRSYKLARGPNPFAPICGLICAHPCEKACRRGNIDEPVSIRALKRFAVESFMKATNSNIYESAALSTAFKNPEDVPAWKKVAVVGSGPAGMAAAHDLARLGYSVTIFESQPIIGGMFYFGIPSYRLPRDVAKFDMDSILSLGIDVRLNITIGKDETLQELFDEGFDAVLIAVGAQLSRPLQIEGAELKGVFNGVSLLRRVNLGESLELGKRVVVIGGGNVAMDVARTIRRLKIKDVHSVCLERIQEIPADKSEISEAIEEGIILHPGKGPQRIIGKDGKVAGLRVIDVASVFDESGRFNPAFIEGSESVIEADSVIIAIGQASDNACLTGCKGFKATRWGTIAVDETMNIGMPGVFAAGDVAAGPGIVIGAVASGQKAARAIDEYLSGKERKTIKKAKMSILKEYKKPAENYINIARKEPPILDAEKRLAGFTQVELGYPEDMAVEQANRCLKCNINTIFNGDLCIACGGCVDVCPTNSLKLTSLSNLAGDENLDKLIQNRFNISQEDYEKNKEAILSSINGAAIIKDEDKCIRCGLCAKRCPTNAITMEKFEFKEVVAMDDRIEAEKISEYLTPVEHVNNGIEENEFTELKK